jgi:hypothetical protein
MQRFFLCLCAACLFAPAASAQGKVDSQFRCHKPRVVHSIDVGDSADHTYNISYVTCSARRGEIGGVKDKNGGATQFDEITADSARFHGHFVENMANGDMIVYSYEGTATLKRGKLVSGSHVWKTIRGTGKFAGIQATGNCNGTGAADGTVMWTCSGTYTLSEPATKPAPKK